MNLVGKWFNPLWSPSWSREEPSSFYLAVYMNFLRNIYLQTLNPEKNKTHLKNKNRFTTLSWNTNYYFFRCSDSIKMRNDKTDIKMRFIKKKRERLNQNKTFQSICGSNQIVLTYYIQTGKSGPFSRFFYNSCGNGEAE